MANNNQIINFILKAIQPFRFLIAGQFLVNAFWAIDFCIRPYLLKILLDRIRTIMPQDGLEQLTGPAALYIAMTLLIIINNRFSDYIWIKLNAPLKQHIGLIVMEKMMHHSHSLFQIHFAGGLGSKIKDAMSGIPDLLRLCANTFFAYFLALSIAVFTVWTVNYTFAIALFVWLVFFLTASMLLSKHAQYLSYQAANLRSQVIGYMVDILGNMMSVRLFNGQHVELEKLKKLMSTWVISNQIRDWYFLWMHALLGFSFIVYQTLCTMWLIYGFMKNQITAGDFVLIFTINISIITIIWKLSEEMGKFADFWGDITQALNIALLPIEIQDKPNANTLTVTQGKIVFNHVQFNYRGGTSIFQNKSITIEPNQKVGLVGYSGSGKSTFINLILRLFDVTKGSILIDDQDIQTITQKSLFDAIGVITQDPTLFHRSLIENIRYGKMNASDEEVILAATKAHAHEFIIQQPEGYETIVGERGIKLSGGQRQRIAIARIFLKNAPILILDEATSQLDSLTENKIQNSLAHLMQNKTTLIIAHRLSTLLHMDRILVFDQGKIVEDGTHQSLLAKNGLYKTLWDSQIGGFLPEKK